MMLGVGHSAVCLLCVYWGGGGYYSVSDPNNFLISAILVTQVINDPEEDGEFLWDTSTQSFILSAFFYGYVVTQIPFGIMAKKLVPCFRIGRG